MGEKRMNLPPPLAVGGWPPLVIALAFLGLGFAAGLFHFGLLRRTARAISDGQARAAAGHLVIRFAATGAVLYLAARLGAAPLLSAALGLAAARFVILRSCLRPAG
jgi:uncharacterized membrane protein